MRIFTILLFIPFFSLNSFSFQNKLAGKTNSNLELLFGDQRSDSYGINYGELSSSKMVSPNLMSNSVTHSSGSNTYRLRVVYDIYSRNLNILNYKGSGPDGSKSFLKKIYNFPSTESIYSLYIMRAYNGTTINIAVLTYNGANTKIRLINVTDFVGSNPSSPVLGVSTQDLIGEGSVGATTSQSAATFSTSSKMCAIQTGANTYVFSVFSGSYIRKVNLSVSNWTTFSFTGTAILSAGSGAAGFTDGTGTAGIIGSNTSINDCHFGNSSSYVYFIDGRSIRQVNISGTTANSGIIKTLVGHQVTSASNINFGTPNIPIGSASATGYFSSLTGISYYRNSTPSGPYNTNNLFIIDGSNKVKVLSFPDEALPACSSNCSKLNTLGTKYIDSVSTNSLNFSGITRISRNIIGSQSTDSLIINEPSTNSLKEIMLTQGEDITGGGSYTLDGTLTNVIIGQQRPLTNTSSDCTKGVIRKDSSFYVTKENVIYFMNKSSNRLCAIYKNNGNETTMDVIQLTNPGSNTFLNNSSRFFTVFEEREQSGNYPINHYIVIPIYADMVSGYINTCKTKVILKIIKMKFSENNDVDFSSMLSYDKTLEHSEFQSNGVPGMFPIGDIACTSYSRNGNVINFLQKVKDGVQERLLLGVYRQNTYSQMITYTNSENQIFTPLFDNLKNGTTIYGDYSKWASTSQSTNSFDNYYKDGSGFIFLGNSGGYIKRLELNLNQYTENTGSFNFIYEGNAYGSGNTNDIFSIKRLSENIYSKSFILSYNKRNTTTSTFSSGVKKCSYSGGSLINESDFVGLESIQTMGTSLSTSNYKFSLNQSLKILTQSIGVFNNSIYYFTDGAIYRSSLK